MKPRKPATLSSNLLARKGDAKPAVEPAFRRVEGFKIPPFESGDFQAADAADSDEAPLVYTDGEQVRPRLGYTSATTHRHGPHASANQGQMNGGRGQIRWVAASFIFAAVVGFGAISWLNRGPGSTNTETAMPSMRDQEAAPNRAPERSSESGTNQEAGANETVTAFDDTNVRGIANPTTAERFFPGQRS